MAMCGAQSTTPREGGIVQSAHHDGNTIVTAVRNADHPQIQRVVRLSEKENTGQRGVPPVLLTILVPLTIVR